MLCNLLTALILSSSFGCISGSWGGLYPRESSSREVKALDGFWDFRLAPLNDPDVGFTKQWYSKPLKKSGGVISMAVPSSYNDVTEDQDLRDHVGWAWYDYIVILPKRWTDDKQRVFIRVGSAHYYAILYINGDEVLRHEGGHLPFHVEITKLISYGHENLVTIALNNTLTPHTIPQGEIVYQKDRAKYPSGYFEQKYDFDFFNYAGIHRHVHVYTTPETYIEDVVISTYVKGTTGVINYEITYRTSDSTPPSCSVKVYDKVGEHLISAIGCHGSIEIEDANLWWPYLMSDDPGYQYKLMVTLSDSKGNLDVYPQRVGIRVLGWNSTTLTINSQKIYFRGCGKHEDADIRGKGVDNPLILKDFSLLKWLGANSFRTSHYPYAEEIMDFADQEGIMVINESPAVGLRGFADTLLERHKTVMEELVRRDKNRPSVVMWSVGNEPKSQEEAAGPYFGNITNSVRNFDPTRPVTCVVNVGHEADLASQSSDVILVNRYFGWYSDTGRTELIQRQTKSDFTAWHLKHNKPVMISEYGAGTLAGVHLEPAFTWSEEYQVKLMLEHFKAFDDLRKAGFFTGEMIWNFADFATPQEYIRPPGCMKGLFTRDRQPKLGAHVMRWHYWSLAKHLHNISMPHSHHFLFSFQ